MKLNQKEIESLHEIAINNLDYNEFDIQQEQTGIGVVTKIWIKISDTEYKVTDITDYECW